MAGVTSTSFRAFVLPKEHGSWSLAFEPVLLGLLVVPSVSGLALAFAVATGFFVRRPLKLFVTLPAGDPRRRAALRWTILLGALALAGICSIVGFGSWMALWPLLLCVPAGAIFLWFDLRNVAREAEAEISGSAAFALLPATFATLAGWDVDAALGLAALMLARSLPTVLMVRTYVRRAKGHVAFPASAFSAAGAAFILVSALAFQRIVPAISLLLTAILLLRTMIFLTSLKPVWSARQLGQCEAIIGILYLLVLAAAYRWNY